MGVDWGNVLQLLVVEVLQQVQHVSKTHLQSPFSLPSVTWLQILIAVCFRLGWIFETNPGSLKAEIVKAITFLGIQHLTALNVEQVTSIITRLVQVNTPGEDVSLCPRGLLREAEFRILQGFHRKISDVISPKARPEESRSPDSQGSQSLVPFSPSASPSAASSAQVSHRCKRRLSFSTVSSVSAKSIPGSDATGVDETALVPAQPTSSGSDFRSSVVARPSLPQNLDDMDRKELKQLIVNLHAQWMRTTDQIAAHASTADRMLLKKVRKAQTKKTNYWKKKAKRQKEESDAKYNQLVYETDVYVNAKRRRKSSFRKKLSRFGGSPF